MAERVATVLDVPARVPLDVDIEDKLLYGLTPIRLGYLIVAMLVAFSVWSAHWAAPPFRAPVALTIVVIGAAAAWGRWRERATDAWAMDLALYMIANYRVVWTGPRPAWL
ncbi:MAG TPA: hypothetical protein VHO95_07290 [Candidatus Dormibacteraeota bacterium]|nr:hypothetical protein [Candidatus Dormibacteraeota bacterium]HEX2679731.1 hypothetical protein [Candidatus Dormibacteraeota bacterium]